MNSFISPVLDKIVPQLLLYKNGYALEKPTYVDIPLKEKKTNQTHFNIEKNTITPRLENNKVK